MFGRIISNPEIFRHQESKKFLVLIQIHIYKHLCCIAVKQKNGKALYINKCMINSDR